jgi:hypothetical protein
MDKRTSITMSQTMLPSQANHAGNVHGGEIMKLWIPPREPPPGDTPEATS